MRVAVAAAVVGVLAGGTAVAAANAKPGSPLWSVSQVINPARAHRLAAEDALAKARQAIADKHPDQAAQLLDKAAKLIADVRDPQQAARLRAELAELEQLLINAITPGFPPPGTSPGGSRHRHPAALRTASVASADIQPRLRFGAAGSPAVLAPGTYAASDSSAEEPAPIDAAQPASARSWRLGGGIWPMQWPGSERGSPNHR